MRRSRLALFSAMVLTLAVAGPAAAAQPFHERPGPQPPIDIAAGDVCDFAVTLTSTVDISKTSVWEHEDGTIRILSRGYASGTVTTEDGRAYTHGGGYRVDVVVHPDGSVEVNGTGNLFAWYFAGDAIVGLSQGIFAISGHVSESYAADASLLGARFYGGNAVDLCEALSPTDA